MVVFPFAKINLGLNVIRLREDGFRDIETVLLPIPLEEVLEVLPDPALPNGTVDIVRTGRSVPGDPTTDLCVRAYQLIHARYTLPGVRVHLHKTIPIGAGLGGGSSDGAHMLQVLDRLFELGLVHREMHELATILGSDCAFFLQRIPRSAHGRGEQLLPVEVNLARLWMVLVDPGIHVSTAETYAATPMSGCSIDLPSILRQPPQSWKGTLVNTMEDPVFGKHPELRDIKEALYRDGAVYASMSGSGSSVFGLFHERPRSERAYGNGHQWIFQPQPEHQAR
ncbi:MAG: 4-(cytidine 5'-diphospho)-2-C-methyl-D-erythritol kinase [Flavobacteriales bacterium]|jgi:4-diphosphocytidyl-2-C-methyl-D-erythritol kinase|nr:4-(cytidine 5'-diphospho)-2-C-methyl-D-erythritol kinase [Flavobacteriales bacterium]MBK7752854.1 4-(cytidine 5'-diphospho)-2-C-methyl-D-erythritol kinase [Flavobacteriales bacterium]MBK9076169.1 4-(cytidine 5'-diphospho)-2-C-methyl-D-erythritol kinase [Flavobacteriales bacterium]MBK9540611.1 4-(cytidine 5'-diphospho)-2-C-methyl-D-erythritol kinase [Flavobacteriales bacterium]